LRYAFIEDHRATWPIAIQCRVLAVSRSGYYQWRRRPVQYASEHYQGVLTQHDIECRLSRKGNCWDNAPVESFFATLKKELVHHETSATRAAARTSLFDYIEVFYNRERRHSALGDMSPVAFEEAA
jgi:transposase InsO family protein